MGQKVDDLSSYVASVSDRKKLMVGWLLTIASVLMCFDLITAKFHDSRLLR